MLQDKLQSMYDGTKRAITKYIAPVVAAAALYAPVQSEAATTISSNIVQNDGGNALVNYTITNSNVGAIFNSASMQYLAQLEDPLMYALANNSSLQAQGITTISQLLSSGLVGVTINTSGGADEVDPEIRARGEVMCVW
jgi:hypothetical protein